MLQPQHCALMVILKDLRKILRLEAPLLDVVHGKTSKYSTVPISSWHALY